MNTQIDQALISYIDKVSNGIGKGVDFVLEQAPDVVHQILVWNCVKSALWFSLGVLFLIGCAWASRWIYRHAEEPGDSSIVLGICVAWFVIIGLMLTTINLEWLQILIAPKSYMFDYARKLAR